ncbi:MAG: hypothetical protein LCH81_12440 [Bacteroidetes bacterium]|nr:hypothetical protein [Bacteroidota bacterium]
MKKHLISFIPAVLCPIWVVFVCFTGGRTIFSYPKNAADPCAFNVTNNEWRLKRVYKNELVSAGEKVKSNVFQERYPYYKFIRILLNRNDVPWELELYNNLEGTSNPSSAVEIDTNAEEWVSKIGFDTIKKGANTSVYGKRSGWIGFEFYFPLDYFSQILDNPKHVLEFRNLRDMSAPYNKFRWNSASLRFELTGRDTMYIKIDKQTKAFPVYVIQQTLRGNGSEENSSCKQVVEIDRTYRVLDCRDAPFILQAEEYSDQYCDNSSPHTICRCPRGSTDYRASKITEIFPR